MGAWVGGYAFSSIQGYHRRLSFHVSTKSEGECLSEEECLMLTSRI